jgi:L-lysine 2,3-aminomutase
MITINMLSDQDRIRIRTLLDFYQRPANLRNPDSKKISCRYCHRRMPMSEFRDHTHNFVKMFEDSHIHTGRKNPHYNKRMLQLVERTRAKLPVSWPKDFNEEDIQYVVHETRVNSARELRAERKAAAKKYRDQQKKSRAINRG